MPITRRFAPVPIAAIITATGFVLFFISALIVTVLAICATCGR